MKPELELKEFTHCMEHVAALELSYSLWKGKGVDIALMGHRFKILSIKVLSPSRLYSTTNEVDVNVTVHDPQGLIIGVDSEDLAIKEMA